MVVAVTAEKKVAIVDRLSRFDEPCFCANRMVGTPARGTSGGRRDEAWNASGLTDFDEHAEGGCDTVDMVPHLL